MVYGTLEEAVRDVSFPKDKDELIDQIGNREVALANGETVSMRELLNTCPHEHYHTSDDVIKCPEISGRL